MRKSQRHVLYALMLAAVGVITACERAGELASVTAPAAGPQYARIKEVKFVKRMKQELDFKCTDKPIGRKGGHLDFSSGKIEVQHEAVKDDTYFCARDNDIDDEYTVELRAFDAETYAPVTRFNGVVKLTLDLKDLGLDEDDWDKIIVVYRAPNGLLEKMPTSQDKKHKEVTASLTHFSDYSPVQN